MAGTAAVATGDLNGDGALDITTTYSGQDIVLPYPAGAETSVRGLSFTEAASSESKRGRW